MRAKELLSALSDAGDVTDFQFLPDTDEYSAVLSTGNTVLLGDDGDGIFWSSRDPDGNLLVGDGWMDEHDGLTDVRRDWGLIE